MGRDPQRFRSGPNLSMTRHNDPHGPLGYKRQASTDALIFFSPFSFLDLNNHMLLFEGSKSEEQAQPTHIFSCFSNLFILLLLFHFLTDISVV